MEQLHAQSPGAEFVLLIGEDNVPLLTGWHRFSDLEQLVRFAVLDRCGSNLGYAYPTIRRKIDISATAIRTRVARGQSIRYLVPDAVAQIIRRENLYQGLTESNPKN